MRGGRVGAYLRYKVRRSCGRQNCVEERAACFIPPNTGSLFVLRVELNLPAGCAQREEYIAV